MSLLLKLVGECAMNKILTCFDCQDQGTKLDGFEVTPCFFNKILCEGCLESRLEENRQGVSMVEYFETYHERN